MAKCKYFPSSKYRVDRFVPVMGTNTFSMGIHTNFISMNPFRYFTKSTATHKINIQQKNFQFKRLQSLFSESYNQNPSDNGSQFQGFGYFSMCSPFILKMTTDMKKQWQKCVDLLPRAADLNPLRSNDVVSVSIR